MNAHPATRQKSLKILHVEDSDTDAYAVERALGKDTARQYTLQRARTIAEAENALKSGPQEWDLVLLDLELPDSTGRNDSYRRISAAKNNDQIPVLILSGVNDQSLAEHLVDDGAEDFVRKSLICTDPETLSDAIAFAVCRHKNWNSLQSRQAQEMGEKDQIIQWMSGGYSG